MELTSHLVEAARSGKREAMTELLAMHYPVVWRMAAGLTGRADVGRGVVKFLMQRSLRVMPSWKDEGAPTRWFHHHTLLTTRRAHIHTSEVSQDTLIFDGVTEPEYVAFIRALRSLPIQQREAFVLCYGERLDTRAIAVAMDCSVLAAGNHLREASDRLRTLAPDHFDEHVKQMGDAYRKLVPDEELAVQAIRERVSRFMLPWLIGRVLGKIVSLALLAAAIWGAYWVYRIARHSMD